MKQIIILINIVLCMNALCESVDDSVYARLSVSSNIWDKSPALYRATIHSNMVEISKNRAIITKDVYSRWMSDFVAYKDESDNKDSLNYSKLYYKSDIMKSYRNVFVGITSTNFWLGVARRIGFVRGRINEMRTKGCIANVKTVSTGRIGNVEICALTKNDVVDRSVNEENLLKKYAEEHREYMLLKRIEKNLLDIVFSGMRIQKIECSLNGNGYDAFCSNFAKQALLTPEEKNYLFKNGKMRIEKFGKDV